jgi:hypothetical protein
MEARLKQYEDKFHWGYFPDVWLTFYLFGKPACFNNPEFIKRRYPHLLTSDAYSVLSKSITQADKDALVAKMPKAARHTTARVQKSGQHADNPDADPDNLTVATLTTARTVNIVRNDPPPTVTQVLTGWGQALENQAKLHKGGILTTSLATQQNLAARLDNVYVSYYLNLLA